MGRGIEGVECNVEAPASEDQDGVMQTRVAHLTVLVDVLGRETQFHILLQAKYDQASGNVMLRHWSLFMINTVNLEPLPLS